MRLWDRTDTLQRFREPKQSAALFEQQTGASRRG
jgi:hypothetical protein